jgi:thioredoxin-related protein
MDRSRRGSVTNAVLVALLFLAGVAVALTFERKKTAVISDVAADSSAPPHISAVLGTASVQNAEGQTVDIVTVGEPAIVMISSVSCSWCKRALGDLRELSAGRPLTRLKLLTLEGAADGAPMVQREHLNGVQLIGPLNNSSRVTLTFRYQGTPTFLAVDRTGRVVQVMPGYPMREVLKLWYNVMVGDAEVP